MTFFVALAAVAAVVGPQDFTLVLPVSPEEPEGQRLIAERALEICAGRYPQLGLYRFTGNETVSPEGARWSRFEVRQELICLDAPPVVADAPVAPADWRPAPEDERRVVALTQRYFALIDGGEAEGVHGLWSPGEQEAVPLARRAAELRDFRRRAGTPGDHRISRLTWYVNPAGAPRPGIYVAADYERSYSGFVLNCGYLVWFREAADRYILIREETNIVERGETAATLETIAQARTLMRCAPAGN